MGTIVRKGTAGVGDGKATDQEAEPRDRHPLGTDRYSGWV